jgi:hypothetical protein
MPKKFGTYDFIFCSQIVIAAFCYKMSKAKFSTTDHILVLQWTTMRKAADKMGEGAG